MLPASASFSPTNEHVGHAVDAAGLADLVADLLVAVVTDHADARFLQLGAHLMGVVAALLGDGKYLDLHGGKPRGTCPQSAR